MDINNTADPSSSSGQAEIESQFAKLPPALPTVHKDFKAYSLERLIRHAAILRDAGEVKHSNEIVSAAERALNIRVQIQIIQPKGAM